MACPAHGETDGYLGWTFASALIVLSLSPLDACRWRRMLPASSPAAASAAAPAEAPNLAFHTRTPTVGARFRSTHRLSARVVLRGLSQGPAKGGSARMEVEVDEVVDQEVLAVEGDVVSRMKVTVVRGSSMVSSRAHRNTTQEPLAGESFVEETKNGAVVFLDDKGAVQPPAVANKLRAIAMPVGRRDTLADALRMAKLSPGDSLGGVAKEIEARLNDGEGRGRFRDVQFKFKSMDGTDAVFDFLAKCSIPLGPSTVESDLHGTAHVTVATTLMREIELRGPLSVRAPESSAVRTEDDGSIEIVEHVEPVEPE